MASSLKVNRVVPSTGTNIGFGTASGEIRLAGTSKLTWDGDTNTYINHPSADTIAAFTTGSERVRITSNGNVLFHNFSDNIGSSSSGEGFEFRRGEALRLQRSGGLPLIVNRIADDGDLITLRRDGSGKADLGIRSNALTFDVSGPERFRIDSAGQIGVGHTNPRGQFVINSTKNALVNANCNDPHHFHLSLKNEDEQNTAIGLCFSHDSTVDRVGAAIIHNRSGDGSVGDMRFYTCATAGTTSERFRITNAGTSYFGLPDINNFEPEAQVNIISHKNMNSDKDDASGYHLVLKNPNNDTGEAVGLGFAITDTASKLGAVIAHKRTDAGSTGELSFYVRHANGSAPTRRLRIGPEGGVTIGSIDNGYANSLLVQAGVYISAYNGDNLITNGSQGGGAATLYIGNQAIQMSSDKRIKKNIVDTTTNVLDKIKQVRVVDFDWDDPSDTASVNRNSRGKWTGCLAQEMVDIFPHVINAPRKEDNSLDYDSDRTWLVDYGHLVPTLIKGMQEQQKQIEELKAEVSSLKSS